MEDSVEVVLARLDERLAAHTKQDEGSFESIQDSLGAMREDIRTLLSRVAVFDHVLSTAEDAGRLSGAKSGGIVATIISGVVAFVIQYFVKS